MLLSFFLILVSYPVLVLTIWYPTAGPSDALHLTASVQAGLIVLRLVSGKINMLPVFWMFMLAIFGNMPCASAVDSVEQKGFNVLPHLDKWDGTPRHDFRLTWFAALMTALGGIAMDGYTLLQTARGQDQGAPGQAGNAAQQQQSANRNIRLFASIMNYLYVDSSIAQLALNSFNSDGRGLYSFIWHIGELTYTQDELEQMNADWDKATMASVGIKFKPNAIFKWKEWVMIHGNKLGKNRIQMRSKFLMCLVA